MTAIGRSFEVLTMVHARFLKDRRRFPPKKILLPSFTQGLPSYPTIPPEKKWVLGVAGTSNTY